MYTFIPWQQIKSYKWEILNPNMLTILLKPRRGPITIKVPAHHHTMVDHIFAAHTLNEESAPQAADWDWPSSREIQYKTNGC